MGEPATESYWDRVGTFVSAISGDAPALETVRSRDDLASMAGALRLRSALALAADAAGVEPAPEWRSGLQASMTSWLLFDQAASSIAETLEQAGCPWAPLKGFDVGTRYYDPREARETGDLDLLVGADRFVEVREALEATGWTGWSVGSRAEQYLRNEGYAWQAVRSSFELLEVHFRFWGAVPVGLESEALAQAVPDRDLGETGLRLPPEYCYLVAAVHGWTQAVPRSLNDWRDMERIVAREADGIGDRVVHLARRWSLQLPVALSAFVAWRLWTGEAHGAVVEGLRPQLSRREGRLLRRLEEAGADGVSWSRIALARLLSGRPSRAGWRSVWRRLWPHPAKVEAATPDAWSWTRRRLSHLRRWWGTRGTLAR